MDSKSAMFSIAVLILVLVVGYCVGFSSGYHQGYGVGDGVGYNEAVNQSVNAYNQCSVKGSSLAPFCVIGNVEYYWCCQGNANPVNKTFIWPS